MTRVLLLGDSHADGTFISNMHKVARDEGVETIIQLGDFGYTFDKNMMASIYAWLDRDENHTWYWIDGNHDQHDYIEEVILADDHGWDKPVAHFHERMFYCPRGSYNEIGSKRCLFLGGAYSIDKRYRKAHVSWWPQEMIRDSDIRRAIAHADYWRSLGTPVDVMLTHDAPSSEWLENELAANGYKVGPESIQNRIALSHVVDAVRPKELYHGHYHSRYTAPYTTDEGWQVNVEGIGANVSFRFGMQEIDHTARANHNYLIKEW